MLKRVPEALCLEPRKVELTVKELVGSRKRMLLVQVRRLRYGD